MAKAIVARQHGDCFQARLFWLNAASLLDPDGHIVRVSFEAGPRGFDDIVIEYDAQRAPLDHEGRPIFHEHIQCKWHKNPGSFGYADFIDPDFINAATTSLLENARQAQVTHAPDGIGCRFKLLSNWRIVSGDPLEALVLKSSDAIDLGRLAEGKTERSRMGRVRKLWCDHLGINESELTTLARTLAIAETLESLESLRTRLDERFASAGLVRISPSSTAFLYDDLIEKLHAQGRNEFDRNTFQEMARAEGILDVRANVSLPSPPTFGVRSFMHPIDNLDERCDQILNLVPFFDGRYIHEPSDWKGRVLPELRDFLRGAAHSSDQLRLILDAHVSLAFAAGTILNVKSGKRIEIEQRGHGRAFWSREDLPADGDWPQLQIEEEDCGGDGGGISVALSLTHDVSPAVRAFVVDELPEVSRIIHCKPETGVSQNSVRCGHHAWMIAESLTQHVKALRQSGLRLSPVHIFMAGPNGLAFFLGQHQQVMGQVTVYEWDFEGQRGGGYSPGVRLA
ncbi:MAG: SAVED domain-containing protein [Candidatus Thiodiazotropha sp.]